MSGTKDRSTEEVLADHPRPRKENTAAEDTGGGRAGLTCDTANEERSHGHRRFLIARRDAKGADDADVLVLPLPDGRTALPVFGLEVEAGMFLWLETAEEAWHVVEISEGGLAALLRGPCAGVRCLLVRPFAADGVGRGPATVAREDFLRTLSVELSGRGEGAGQELPPVIPARGREDFW
jgi:hypothetical protein